MEFKLKLNDKEKSYLKRVLAVVLFVSYGITGLFALAYLVDIGYILETWQAAIALVIYLVQMILVMRAVFKVYI
jgi:hypothetical protein